MPSPFPGMDPYFEVSGRWPTFHTPLMVTISEVLNRVLPERFVAMVDERLLLGEADEEDRGRRQVIPDVSVRDAKASDENDVIVPTATGAAGAASVGTLAPHIVPQAVTRLDTPTQKFVDVVDARYRRIVTTIEVLSPANKRPGRDREAYLEKRRASLFHEINLVEIDLLLGGRRLPLEGELPDGDYFAFVTDVQRTDLCQVYAWSVRDRLPTIGVPLSPHAPAVPLDLAEAFNLNYERGRCERTTPYDRPPPRLLAQADRRWAEELAATRRH